DLCQPSLVPGQEDRPGPEAAQPVAIVRRARVSADARTDIHIVAPLQQSPTVDWTIPILIGYAALHGHRW
ncbi:MAG: hypothetical protein ACRYGI_19715, partial [Janthinobacterium lividum]